MNAKFSKRDYLERSPSLSKEQQDFTLHVHSRITNLKYRSRKFNAITPLTLLKRSWELIHTLPSYITSRKDSLAKSERDMASLERIKSTPFPQEKKDRIKVIQEKIQQLQTKNNRKRKL